MSCSEPPNPPDWHAKALEALSLGDVLESLMIATQKLDELEERVKQIEGNNVL